MRGRGNPAFRVSKNKLILIFKIKLILIFAFDFSKAENKLILFF